MSAFLHNYAVVGLVALLPVALVGGALCIGGVLRPRRPTAQKSVPYESGVDPVGRGWSPSYVRYYLYALLFVVFDVEVAFIVPWAVQVEGFGAFGLGEMAVFAAILLLGLLYAWRKGVLSWDS